MNENNVSDPISEETLLERPSDAWIGSTPRAVKPFVRLEVEPPTSDRSPDVPPILEDASSSPGPRLTAPPTRRRLWHRGREARPLHIINADDRTLYNDWRYPWGLVCRVDRPDGQSGSGVLVGPRHVLTASHCVDWNDLQLTVQVHTARGVARASAVVEAAGCFTKVGQQGHEDTVDEDYAVLVLDQRLGERFGTMGVRTYDSKWDERELWRTIGYAEDLDRFESPLYMKQFFLDEDSLDAGWGRAMSTNADVVHGQSGSPVFSFWDDGPYVVAVVVAELGDENYCSGGNGLTTLVNVVISQYP